jgi:hypothetical protein
LVEELLRAAAKLHRRKDIDLDPALGFRLDLARPGAMNLAGTLPFRARKW